MLIFLLAYAIVKIQRVIICARQLKTEVTPVRNIKGLIVMCILLLVILISMLMLVGCDGAYRTYGLYADKTELVLEIEESETVTVSGESERYKEEWAFWESSDTSVVIVRSGVITAVGEGTATVTATSNKGAVATVSVTVLPPAVSLKGMGTEDDMLYRVFPSSTESVSLDSIISLREGVECTVSHREDRVPIDSDTLSLNYGDNIFYIELSYDGWTASYTVNLIRRGTVTLTFDSGEGSAVEAMTVDSGVLVNLPKPSLYAHRFVGWYNGDTLITDWNSRFYTDTHLTAKWDIATYSVKASANFKDACLIYGTGGYKHNTEATVYLAEKDNIGYVFDGWYDADGNLLCSERSYTFTVVGEGVTLYPVWNYADGFEQFFFESNAGYCTITRLRQSKSVYIIPEGVTEIAYNSFTGCEKVLSVTIPESVTKIEDCAFRGCERLIEVYNFSSLDIKAGSKEHGYVGLNALDVYTDPAAKSKISTDENGFVFYDGEEGSMLIAYHGSATEIMLPAYRNGEGYVLRDYAFFDCTSLTSAVLGDGVTGIGVRAFENCNKLERIELSDSVEYIGSYVFYNCSKLESITIPTSVQRICGSAFKNCNKLSEAVFEETEGWVCTKEYSNYAETTVLDPEKLADFATAAEYLGGTYCFYEWTRE